MVYYDKKKVAFIPVRWRKYQGDISWETVDPGDFAMLNFPTPEANYRLCSTHFTIPLVGLGLTPGASRWHQCTTVTGLNLIRRKTKLKVKPLIWCKNSLPVGNSQERIKLRELITHIGPIPIVIPLKLFLERAGLPADNISSRVAWKFHGGAKVQNKSEVRELRWMRNKRG